jgi:hypothetical protein
MPFWMVFVVAMLLLSFSLFRKAARLHVLSKEAEVVSQRTHAYGARWVAAASGDHLRGTASGWTRSGTERKALAELALRRHEQGTVRRRRV